MSRFYRLRVAELRRETADAVVLRFALPDVLSERFRYVQGQHLTLRRTFEGVEERRNYSICASVAEAALRIAVKRLPGGRFSNFINDEVQVGDELEVMPPSGRFYTELDPQVSRRYLAIAAGSGITPILSLIKTALETEPDSRCTLIYANRRSSSILFLEALSELKDRYLERFWLIHVLSREPQDCDLLSGRLDAAKLQRLSETVLALRHIDQCFICGPQALLETASAALQRCGLARERVHFELFTAPGVSPLGRGEENPPLPAAQAAQLCEVTVILDAKRTTLQLRRGAESILDAALRQRRDLPYACKGGMCCTCRAKVLQGQVTMDVCYGLEEEEVAAGHVLTCQAHPVSDRVVVDYDQR